MLPVVRQRRGVVPPRNEREESNPGLRRRYAISRAASASCVSIRSENAQPTIFLWYLIPRTQVFYDCQIKPAFAGGHVSDITHPGLIRTLEGKVSHQQVRRNGMAVIGICGSFVGPAPGWGDASQPHLPVYPLAGAAKFRFQKVVQAVQLHGGVSQLHQPPSQSLVAPAPFRRFMLQPAVITAAGYFCFPAYLLHRDSLGLDAAIFLLYGFDRISCMACERACPAALSRREISRSPECTQCGKCVDPCPEKCLHFSEHNFIGQWPS